MHILHGILAQLNCRAQALVVNPMAQWQEKTVYVQLQIVGIDFQAVTLAFAACFVPALKQMNRHRPEPISTLPAFVLLGSMAFLGILVQVINMIALGHQAWYVRGNGQSNEVRTQNSVHCLSTG